MLVNKSVCYVNLRARRLVRIQANIIDMRNLSRLVRTKHIDEWRTADPERHSARSNDSPVVLAERTPIMMMHRMLRTLSQVLRRIVPCVPPFVV